MQNSATEIFVESNIGIITKSDDRFHLVDGEYYPRVTWVNSYYPAGEGLKRWLGDSKSYEDAQDQMARAATRGTNVHGGCARLIAGEQLYMEQYSEQEWGMLSSFVHWVEDYKPSFLASEKFVVSRKYKYAGTFDALIEAGGRKILVDFKTSANIYSSFFSQISAYVQAARECKVLKAKELVSLAVLRLGSRHKRGYEFKEDEFEKHFEIFLSVKRIFHHENTKLEPETKEIQTSLKL